MARLLRLCVLVFLVGPQWAEGQSQTYHKVKQLRDMVRLFRAIKNFVKAQADAINVRSPTMLASVLTAENAVDTAANNLKLGTINPWADTDNLVTSIGLTYTSACKAHAKVFASDPSYVHLSNVDVDRGMGASSTAQSEVMVTRSGVYLYELKVQTGDFTSEYAEMAVLDSAGNTKKSYEFWTDWEVAPHYRFLNLEAGDIVYNYGINKAEVKNVYIGTQFSLRLLSNYIQPDIAYTVASTSAPSYCDLNPNSWWCYYYGYYYY